MQIKLHFIGTGLYGAKRFIRESQRLGVNRGLPWAHLSGLNFGDPIYLAEYIREDANLELVPNKPLKKVNAGAAVIFGYYTTQQFTYTNMPPEVAKHFGKLFAEAGLVEEIKDYSKGGGVAVVRACGSYSIVSVIYLKDSASIAKIQELIRKACDLANAETKCKHCGAEYKSELDAITDPEHDRSVANADKFNHKFTAMERKHFSPNSIKYFIGGAIVTFREPIVLEHIDFARGLKSVNIGEETQEGIAESNTNLQEFLQAKYPEEKKALVLLKDYKLNSYVPAKERKDQGFAKTILEEYDSKLKEVSDQ